ncbi:DNA topoisomerase (ATP-hydrolyzing) subunit A [Brevibacillus sp. NPDC058079]|uniref:DNA gyrase/topoisomerase IV subunit A n=1 Tax=Brevibacillus sp. NPDC058079 TaxID=3346330 RepID=UPI0036EAFCCA
MSAERIIDIEYASEMKNSYRDYATSVIKRRALPDARDGLKPVHRRILFTMDEIGLHPDKAHRKSAKVVGEVMSKYHPHGDSAIYETMVGMTQDFRMLLPLINGQGNFGSIDGDPAAAMRYTESKLSTTALEILENLNFDVVEMVDNFDGYHKEPVVLPTKFPNLLVNGASGIAVGMATSIPSHNVNEVINAIVEYIKDPSVSVKKLMKYMKGPDFPTGGIITNKQELLNIYEKGSGSIRVRAKMVEEVAGHGRTNLVITEIPITYAGSKSRLIQKIIDLMKDRKLEELSDVRDESDKNGIRIVLELKRGVDIQNLKNKLFKKTPLEDTFSCNFLALVNNEPVTLSLRDMIHHFVEFQREITLRKHTHLLKKARDRWEVLEGQLKAIDVIDTIIEVLRGSPDINTVKSCLTKGITDGIHFKTKRSEKEAKKLDFTELQTESILSMELQRLIQLEVHKVNKEMKEVRAKIEKSEGILKKEAMLVSEITSYLNEIKKTHGTLRKTSIEEIEAAIYIEEVKEEELHVLIDRFGYIKTIDFASFKRIGEETVKEFSFVFPVLNTEKIFFFTNKGNFGQVKALDIPKGKVKDKGVPLDTIKKMEKNESLVWVGNEKDIFNKNLLFVTRAGLIKIVDGIEYQTNRNLISAIRLNESDELMAVQTVDDLENDLVVLLTKHEYAIKYDVKNVPLQKKNGKGVSGIELVGEDEIVDVIVIKNAEKCVRSFNDKEIQLKKIPLKKRGQKGTQLSILQR